MKEKQIEVVYNHEKRQLTILEAGKPVGGFCGPVATSMMKKIAFNNAKIIIEDDHVQIGL